MSMLALTHLVLVVLLIRLFHLNRDEAFATLLFGVFIDLDHFLGMADFIAKDGWSNALNLNAAMTSGVQWKSLIHSPVGAFLVLPVVIGFRFVMPAVAWGLHLLMDYVQMTYLGIASVPELVLLAAMCLCILYLDNKDYRHAGHDGGAKDLLSWEVERYSKAIFELPVLRTIKTWRGPRGTSG